MKLIYAVPFIVVALALIGCGEKAPETSKVSGKVTLADGKPLPGGRIDLHSSEHGMVAGTIGSDGAYQVPDVKPGEYQVSVVNSHLKGLGNAPVPAGVQAMPGTGETYVEIDQKYSKPETSGLSVKVGEGEQTYDIELK